MPLSLIDQEYSDFDNMELFKELERRLAEHGFEDASWHNDACPSLMAKVSPDNEEACVKVWVEFADPAKREVRVEGDLPGFSVVIVEKNSEDEMVSEIICTESDLGEPGEVTNFIWKKYKPGGQEVDSETTRNVAMSPVEVAVALAEVQIRGARWAWENQIRLAP